MLSWRNFCFCCYWNGFIDLVIKHGGSTNPQACSLIHHIMKERGLLYKTRFFSMSLLLLLAHQPAHQVWKKMSFCALGCVSLWLGTQMNHKESDHRLSMLLQVFLFPFSACGALLHPPERCKLPTERLANHNRLVCSEPRMKQEEEEGAKKKKSVFLNKQNLFTIERGRWRGKNSGCSHSARSSFKVVGTSCQVCTWCQHTRGIVIAFGITQRAKVWLNVIVPSCPMATYDRLPGYKHSQFIAT